MGGCGILGRMIEPILLIFAGLPTWVTYAASGAVFGAGGAVAGWLIGKAGWPALSRFAVIAAIVGSVQFSRISVVPAVENARLNEGLPTQVDEYTTLELASLSGRVLTYQFTLSGDFQPDLDVGQIKSAGIDGLCQNWMPDFLAGRLSRVDYTYTWETGSGVFSLTQTDCESR